MALDETGLIDGELYTFLVNKDAKGKKGTLAGLIKGTKSEHVVNAIYNKTDLTVLVKIKELTIDLANNMDWIARQIAPNGLITYDRFHVQQLVSDALQTIRIKYRWEAIDEENDAILRIKELNKKNKKEIENGNIKKQIYRASTYSNGDTKKQLLARGRYLLYKAGTKWNKGQEKRSKILFEQYPHLEKAYHLSMYFRNIYETNKNKKDAEIAFNKWFDKIESETRKIKELKPMQSASESVNRHMSGILNYFVNRATNGYIEGFNSTVKLFRSRIRGVGDKDFFFYRIKKYFS